MPREGGRYLGGWLPMDGSLPGTVRAEFSVLRRVGRGGCRSMGVGVDPTNAGWPLTDVKCRLSDSD